jgi:hypothetical protein
MFACFAKRKMPLPNIGMGTCNGAGASNARDNQLQLSCVLSEILSDAIGVCLHASLALVPASRTNFTVLFGELQRVDHADHFVDIAAERQIVNNLVTHYAVAVDQEGTTVSDAIGSLNVERLANFVPNVSDQSVLDGANAALFDWRIAPCAVRELAVNRHTDDFNIALLELVDTMVEGDQFAWANKSKVERVEEHNGVLATGGVRKVVAINDFAIAQDGGCSEFWGFLTNENGHIDAPECSLV